MPSTYTGLGIDKMATGENAGTWGTATNTNLEIIEQFAGGYTPQALSSTPTTLSVSDGATGAVLAHRIIEFTGSIGENFTVTIPLDVQTFYIIKNGTTGGYTVTFKYVSGSDSGVTWGTTDKGTKIVYASASDATNPALVDTGFGTGDVTLTGTQTLTNKTLTAPKIVDGGFIADGGGDENLVFGEVGTPVNELKITNAATGAGPILSSVSTSATDTNIDINIIPAGTGDVVLAGDTVKVGDAAAAATLTSNGAGTLTVTTGGTENLILSTNSGTNSGTITITDAANGDINLTPNGTGNVQLYADEVTIGDSGATATLTSNGTGDLLLNTNSGTNSSAIQITDAANGDITFTNNGTGKVKFNDAAYNPEATLTDGATIAWDAQAEPVAKVTLGASRILGLPTNPVAGAFISLLIIQDGTGSRTITWNAAFEFPSDAAPTLTTTADLADLFVFRYHNTKWLQVGSTLALTVA